MTEWLDEPDNFIVHASVRLKQCKDCLATHEAKLEAEELVKKGKKLLAMDLFSGEVPGYSLSLLLPLNLSILLSISRCWGPYHRHGSIWIH